MRKVLIILLVTLICTGCSNSKIYLATKKVVDKAYTTVDKHDKNISTLANQYVTLIKANLNDPKSKLTPEQKKEVLKRAESLVKEATKGIRTVKQVITILRDIIYLIGGEKPKKEEKK